MQRSVLEQKPVMIHFHYNNTPIFPVANEKSQAIIDSKPLQKKRIAVHSFDFDGCLFNMEYLKFPGSQSEKVIGANRNLFNYIANRINQEKFSEVIIMSGTARQSHEIEKFNEYARGWFGGEPDYSRRTGLAAPMLKAICDEISLTAKHNCVLDPVLMSDIYGGRKAGHNYGNIINTAYEGLHDKSVSDEYKITLLYMQIHKVASENPDAEIDFNFYDDRDDILDKLDNKFFKYPNLLPKNIVLHLNRYNGVDLTAISRFDSEPRIIKGEGLIDKHYRKTIMDFALSQSSNLTLPSMIWGFLS